MTINWFPGHMTTARKDAAKTMANVDLVIEVVDARLPGASGNPLIDELRLHRQRPRLKVLNKADLADPVVTAAWLRAFEASGDTAAIAVSSRRAADVAKIPGRAAALVPHRTGPGKHVRALVMGIPNVGKSTLINALLKRRAAAVGDEPGITRQQARYETADRVTLVDTPGLTAPAVAFEADGLMLAASHAIGVNAYQEEEVAPFLATILLARYRRVLVERYALVDAVTDGAGVIAAIAERRGFRMRGGAPDEERAARTLLGDFRDGVLGRISLETPQSRAAMTSRVD